MKRLSVPKGLRLGGGRLSLPVPYLAMRSWTIFWLRQVRHAILSRVEWLAPSRLDVWLALLLSLGMLGFLAIVVGFTRGHERVFSVQPGMPWGVLISTYVFFVVTASGLCLISSLGHVFGVRRFEPLGARAHLGAIITLVAGFIAIGAELERPWRLAVYAVLSPNLSSPIWWMGTLYVFELMFQVTEFMYLNRGNMAQKSRESAGLVAWLCRMLALGSTDISHKALRKNMRIARWAGIGGVTTAVAAISTLGAVFGLAEARPWWHGPYMPIYFILSALVSGAAILALTTFVAYRVTRRELTPEEDGVLVGLGNLLVLFLGAFLFFLVWNTIVRRYGNIPGESEALMLLLKGPLSLPFWGFEVLLGILVPFSILLYPKTRTILGVGVASFLVLIGLFAARYDLVIAGQLIPVTGGTEIPSYIPSYTEWLIVGGVFAFCAFMFTLGERIIPLRDLHVDPWA